MAAKTSGGLVVRRSDAKARLIKQLDKGEKTKKGCWPSPEVDEKLIEADVKRIQKEILVLDQPKKKRVRKTLK